MSADLLTQTSFSERLHLLFIMMWSISLLVVPSGDFQVSLGMSLCWKRVPPTVRPFDSLKSHSISPLSFITPTPCLPRVFPRLSLLLPTLALKLPNSSSTSCLGILSTVSLFLCALSGCLAHNSGQFHKSGIETYV